MSGIDFNSRISYEPYHIYYDLNILNNDTTGTQRPPFLQFTEIRNSPYLMNPSDYFCSVVRFSLETPSLPVIIPQVQIGQNDPNLTVYSVNIAHPTLVPNGVQKFVSFVPQSSLVLFPTPTTPIAPSALVNEYYYTFTYKPFIDMVNTALKSAWTDFLTASPIATYTAANAPYLYLSLIHI